VRRRLQDLRSACLPAEACVRRSHVPIYLSLLTSLETADALAERLGHHAFRLFVRGVIRNGDGFTREETTSYVSSAPARTFTETLIALGMVASNGRDRYRLLRRAASFGGMLEWYVGRELRRWLGFDVATGVKFHARGIGRSRSGHGGRREADLRRAAASRGNCGRSVDISTSSTAGPFSRRTSGVPSRKVCWHSIHSSSREGNRRGR
jgi:hypothetical protein